MVDILLLQTVPIAIASASVVAGVIYYTLQLRHQIKQRQTDLVMKLYSAFGSKEFLKTWEDVVKREARDYDDYMKRYGWTDVLEIGLFFEGIGILLHRKLISIELVDDLFSDPINMTWKRMKDFTIEARKIRNTPSIFEWFEYLYNEMKKREQQLQAGAKNG